MSYKIQNRTAINQRIKVIKRADGSVTFPDSPMPTFQENTMQAGWCMTPIPEIPEYQQPRIDFILSALPMGVAGRVSIYRNGTLASSMRFKDLNGSPAKVAWFNGQFGAVVELSMLNGGRVKFKSREGDNQIAITFEDDDIDFIAGNFRPDSGTYTAYFREQYRLGIAMEQTEIDCTGAIDWAGILTFNDQVEGSVNNDTGVIDFVDTDGMVSGLEAKGFTVIPLNEWEPRPSKIYHPRQTVYISNAADSEGNTTPFESIPEGVTAVIKQDKQNPVMYTGNLVEVMDKCQSHGILIRAFESQFQIGCEPNTPYTEVRITVPSLDLAFNEEVSYKYENWQNETVRISADGHTISGNFGWDDLTEFWCFSRPNIPLGNGDVGETLSFPDIDITVAGTFPDDIRHYVINTDFTDECSSMGTHQKNCRIVKQQNEACMRMNDAIPVDKVALSVFNQNWVYGAFPDEFNLVTIEGYVKTALRFTPNTYCFGYTIPEPSIGM